jgi:hypothetical protein
MVNKKTKPIAIATSTKVGVGRVAAMTSMMVGASVVIGAIMAYLSI